MSALDYHSRKIAGILHLKVQKLHRVNGKMSCREESTINRQSSCHSPQKPDERRGITSN